MGGLLAREIARSKILCLMSWGQLSNVTLFFYKLSVYPPKCQASQILVHEKVFLYCGE